MKLSLLAATAALCAGAMALAACDRTEDAAEAPAAAPAPAETAAAAPTPPPAPAGPALAIETVGGGAPIDVTLPDAIDPATGEVNKRFTGYGDNVSPAIQWTPVDGAQAYVVVLQDPVAMADGSTFMVLHWAAYNIPGTSLPEGVPAGAQIPGGGAQIANLMQNVGYSGMQPPANRPPHQYTWQVFALDMPLSVASDVNLDGLLAAMQGHVIGSGSEVTPYSPPPEAQPMPGVSLDAPPAP